MLQLTPETKSKLRHSKRILGHEFEHLQPEEIALEIEWVTHHLLAQARFDDYIPVLAHRHARENLRERSVRDPRGTATAPAEQTLYEAVAAS